MLSVYPRSDIAKALSAVQLNICTNLKVHSNGPDTSYKVYTRGLNTEEKLQAGRPCGYANCALFFAAGHRHSESRGNQSFKLHDRIQVGPPKALQCARARENV